MTFKGMIMNFAKNLGQFKYQFDETGLADNSILIYLTNSGSVCGAQFADGLAVLLASSFNATKRRVL